MRIFHWLPALLVCALTGSVAAAAELRFNFGDYPEGALPTNFVATLAGGGPPGVWKILGLEEPSAAPPGGNLPGIYRRNVLAQTSQDSTDDRFPMLLYTGERFRDFKFTTRFKIVSGATEQIAGVVFRYQNPTNYYVVRASALDRNLRFYKVVNGAILGLIGPDLAVPTNVWHTLTVQCEGNQIQVWFNDRLAIPVFSDNFFSEGRLGFRTMADTVAYFSEASVDYRPLIPAAQAAVNRVLANQPRLLNLRIYAPQTNGPPRVIAAKNPAEIGLDGTEAETKTIADGATFYGREKGASTVTLPLHDRNGEFIAALRVQLKSFFGETQDNAIARARLILQDIQSQIQSAKDLQ